MQWLRNVAKRVLPDRFVQWYRRRRAMRRYLKELAFEVYDRTIRVELDEVEERIAARRQGFYGRLVRDVLERTEIILQELDRRIEGISARHGNDIRELREDLTSLQTMTTELQQRLAELQASLSADSIPARRAE